MSADPAATTPRRPDAGPASPSGRTRPRRPGSARGWAGWLARRIGLAILTLFVVSVLIFFATVALGDPVRAILGRDYVNSPERVATLRAELGLDRPPVQRYLDWLGGLFTGDLGTSLANRTPVADLIAQPVINSAVLVLIATLVIIPLSFGLALWSASARGKRADHIIQTVLLALAGLPEFVIGIVLVAVFSTTVFFVLPAVTISPGGDAPWLQPASMVLPVLTLVLTVAPYVSRIVRATLVEVLDSDYVALARLKGVPESVVVRRHALRNALVPGVQVTALQLAWLAGGIVIVEYLFSYPGIGAQLVSAVNNNDVPVVLALAMIIAAVYVVVNLIADIASILLTPRARTAIAG
ncbi:ABC transporter permease [Naumannella huperziae]